MAIWNQFPFTDFHQENLDWVLEGLKTLEVKRKPKMLEYTFTADATEFHFKNLLEAGTQIKDYYLLMSATAGSTEKKVTALLSYDDANNSNYIYSTTTTIAANSRIDTMIKTESLVNSVHSNVSMTGTNYFDTYYARKETLNTFNYNGYISDVYVQGKFTAGDSLKLWYWEV